MGVKCPRTVQARKYYFGIYLPYWEEKFCCTKEIANQLFKLTYNEGFSYEYTESEKFWEDIEEGRELFLHDFGILIPLPKEEDLPEEHS